MSRFVSFWNDFWFFKTSLFPLAVCRIVVAGTQLLLFLPSLGEQINLLEGGAGFTEPQLLIVAISNILSESVFLTSDAFTAIYWIAIITGILTLIGLLTRTSAFVFALSNWIFVAHEYSYAEEHHAGAIFCIFLLLFAFSPSGRVLSVDALLRRMRSTEKDSRGTKTAEAAIWPLKFIFVLLAMTYFSAGLAKVMYGGLEWMNGYTLQQILLAAAVQREIPMGIWLAQQHTLCVLLSIFTIFFELFFFVSLFVPSIGRLFLASGIMFHIGLHLTGGHGFFQHMVLLALILVFYKAICGLERECSNSEIRVVNAI